MSNVVVVENPRRRRRSRKRSRSRRRRNPGLALMAGNPRRRSRRRSYRMYSSGRRYRRRSNPGFGSFGGGIDLPTAGFVAGGFILAEVTPGLVAKAFPALPRTGVMGHLVKAGGVLAVGFVSGYVLPANRRNQLVAGGLASVLYGLYNEYLAPAIGLSGASGFVSVDELSQVVGANGINGFIARDRNMLNGMGQFVPEPKAEMITG